MPTSSVIRTDACRQVVTGHVAGISAAAGSVRFKPPTLRSGDTPAGENMIRGLRPLDQDVPVFTVLGSLEGSPEMICPLSKDPPRGDPEVGMADVVTYLVREMLDVQIGLQVSLKRK